MKEVLAFLTNYSIFFTLPFSLLSALIILCGIFLYWRDRGKLKILAFAELYVQRFQNFLLLKKNHPGNNYQSYVPEGKSAERNFYKEFAKVLENAEAEIFNSGDGFNMFSAADKGGEWTSRQKADTLDKAIVRAMKKNPSLVYSRFQILSACNINWLSRLIFLKKEYGQNFRVFVNREYDHMGCFCAIDPKSGDCVFEWQLVSGRRYSRGTVSKGFGFIYANKNICQVVSRMFTDMIKAPATNQLAGDANHDVVAEGLSVAKLEALQRELWERRVKSVHEDSGQRVLDHEIEKAFVDRGVNRKKFALEEMEFNPDEFPPVPL